MAPRNRTNDSTYLLILVAVFSLILFSVSIAALAASNDIEVISAVPPEMEQSQTIDVIIKGNGFDMSAAAKFLISGTKKTGGVTVNSTTFIDAQTLRANVTAAPDAVVGNFDIEVQLSKGRRGKGIELFNVKAGTNQGETGGCEGAVKATFRDFLGDFFTPPHLVRSDGLGPYIGGELEVDNVGISRWMFTIGLDNSGGGDPLDRQFTLDFSECASPGECTPPTPPTEPMSFNSPFMAPGGALGVKRNKEENPDVNFCTMANGATLGGILGFIRFYTKDDPDRKWFVTFGPIGSKKARKDACSGSSFLFAHRVDENTWEFGGVEPLGCLTRDAARGGGFSFHGLYKMPFLVTAERVP